ARLPSSGFPTNLLRRCILAADRARPRATSAPDRRVRSVACRRRLVSAPKHTTVPQFDSEDEFLLRAAKEASILRLALTRKDNQGITLHRGRFRPIVLEKDRRM